jgi:hypothetical protein
MLAFRKKQAVFGRAARAAVKTLFHTLGLDIVHLKNVPRETLAGLRHRPICTVIDCGANEGQFARYISRFFPDAALYCFEPLDNSFRSLSAWAATQNNRVRCFDVALGDREGTAVMHHHVDHVIGAGACMTRDIEPYAIMAGIPTRKIGKTFWRPVLAPTELAFSSLRRTLLPRSHISMRWKSSSAPLK